jgi:chemotaxis protein CheD
MIICVAGGAQVMDTSGFFNIGKRNYEAIKQIFNQNGVRIHAEQVGGLVSRSMYLHLDTGEVRLKVSGQPNDFILCKI